MSTGTYMNIKGQGNSFTFVQGHSDSTFSDFFCSETARPIEAKFHMEPPWEVGNENLFKCSRSHDHAHIWWKTSKIFFGTKRQMTLKLGIQHRYLSTTNVFIMMTLGWPWPFLWQGQICFWIPLHGWKHIQHWVLIYFQVCSNSAYPQHSGEQYRTNGHLVIIWLSHFVLISQKTWRETEYVMPILFLVFGTWPAAWQWPLNDQR